MNSGITKGYLFIIIYRDGSYRIVDRPARKAPTIPGRRCFRIPDSISASSIREFVCSVTSGYFDEHGYAFPSINITMIF